MILEVDNIELNFDQTSILQGIYLKAETQKVTCVLGRNGCGKSSLLKIIFGSLKAKYSLVRLNKNPITKKFFQTGLVNYLPQHHYIPKEVSVKKAFQLYSCSWEAFLKDFDSFLVHKNAKINELSGGERRIIETYLVLQSKAKVLLLDEPFSNIAPLQIEKIKQIIQQQKEEKIIVLTDHFYEDVLEVADVLYTIHHKRSHLIKDENDLVNFGYLTSAQKATIQQ